MKHILTLCILALLLTACGGYSGVVAKDNLSYIKFTGDWKGCQIQVDNSELLPLETTTTMSPAAESPGKEELISSTRLFEISPGKHTVKVFRGEQLLVKRMLFFGNHQTTEVRVP